MTYNGSAHGSKGLGCKRQAKKVVAVRLPLGVFGLDGLVVAAIKDVCWNSGWADHQGDFGPDLNWRFVCHGIRAFRDLLLIPSCSQSRACSQQNIDSW